MVDVLVEGRFAASGAHDIEANFAGGEYQTIDTGAIGSFSGTMTGLSAGAGSLIIRLTDDTTKSITIANFAVGDIFVIAGQSNASGYTSAVPQVWSHATLFAGLFGNDYRWKRLNDPTDNPSGQIDTVSQDNEAINGSMWPLLADFILDNANVPVAFVPCPKGATAISSWLPGVNHEDRTTLYGSMIYRARQLKNGVKAVLWHQGESDALLATSRADYNAMLDLLASAIMDDLGVPIVAAKIHKWDGAPNVTQEAVDAINLGIDDAWNDNPNVLAGPNFNSPNLTAGLHFSTAEELADAAGRWWTALQSAFYI